MPSKRPVSTSRRRALVNPLDQPRVVSTRSHARAWKAAGFAAVVLAVAAAVGAFVWAAQLSRTISFGGADSQQIQAQLAAPSSQAYNVLIAGVDTDSKGRTSVDSLILVYTNAQSDQTWALWLPPSLIQSVPSRGSITLAAARAQGGAATAIQAVRKLTGLPVSEYAEVQLPAMQRAVDALGGIWVNVPASIEDTSADSSPNHEAGRLDIGTQRLDGYRTLTFMRARPSAFQGDYARQANQQQAIGAITGALAGSSDSMKRLGLFATVSPYVKTTMSLGTLSGLEKALVEAGPGGTYNATVVGTQTADGVTPDQSVLLKLIGDMRARRAFDVPAAELAKAAADSANVVSRKAPARVSVMVENGGGVPSAAKEAAGVLQGRGFRIVGTGNAGQNVYPHTFVIYKTNVGLANLVARQLPAGARIVRSFGFYAFKSDVLVIVGRDWNVGKVPPVPIVTQ